MIEIIEQYFSHAKVIVDGEEVHTLGDSQYWEIEGGFITEYENNGGQDLGVIAHGKMCWRMALGDHDFQRWQPNQFIDIPQWKRVKYFGEESLQSWEKRKKVEQA